MESEYAYKKVQKIYENILKSIPPTKKNKNLLSQISLINNDKKLSAENKRKKLMSIFSILFVGLQVGKMDLIDLRKPSFIQEINFKINSGRDVELLLYTDHAQIKDSYDFSFNERMEVLNNIIELGAKNNIKIPRSINNMETEWYVHNVCYNIGFEKESSKDADIDFIADSRWYVNFVVGIVELLDNLEIITKSDNCMIR